MLVPGTPIDRYVIEGPAAYGLLGSLYLALDPVLVRRVALELIPKVDPNDEVIELRRDWPSATALTHPAIVRLYDFGMAGSDLFLVSEHVPGRTLRDVLRTQSPPSITERLRWMEDLCRAVADGLRLGLQHGGLTPDILIVADDGRLRISGFGMRALYAKRRQQPDVIVQPGYEAPELMAGASVDGRSDVFSLGAICFELLTGGRAFPGGTVAEIAFRTLGLDVVPRVPDGPEVDPELVATIAQALERDRARRLGSAAELAAVVARVRARPASETSAWVPPMPPPPASVPPAASVETQAGREPARDASRPLEHVQFTVYRPRSVQASRWARMLAFMHLAGRRPGSPAGAPSPEERVRALALAALGSEASAFSAITSDARHGVPPEGEITLIPTMELVEFNPERRMFRWVEDVHQESFLFRAHPLHIGTVVPGSMAVYSGALLIAQIDISIRVERASDAHQPPEPSTAVPYRKIFASYAHADREIVRQFERYVESLGDRYLIDLRDLRSGDTWRPRLLELIDQADVFQLFWSTSAMRSPHVRREWEHALSLGRSAFVRPTYWEDPLPASDEEGLPPATLQRIHFHRLCLPDQVADVARSARESEMAHAMYRLESEVERDARRAEQRRAEDEHLRALIRDAGRQLELGELDQALLTCREALRLRATSIDARELKSRIETALAEHHRVTDEQQQEHERRTRAVALERERSRREEAIQAAVGNGRELLQRGEIEEAERVVRALPWLDREHAAIDQLEAEIDDARDRRRAETNQRQREEMERSRRAAAEEAEERRAREAAIARERTHREAASQAALRDARMALERGELERSSDALLSAMQLDPDNADAGGLRTELEAARAEERRQRELEALHRVEVELRRTEGTTGDRAETARSRIEAEESRSPNAQVPPSAPRPAIILLWLLVGAITIVFMGLLLRSC
jgi:tetratricopeptide (TPR) repeat protein